MKLYLVRLLIDQFALHADLTNTTHVRILHWAKNYVTSLQCRSDLAELRLLKIQEVI